MPNYTKPLWIVLDPKGKAMPWTLRELRRDAISESVFPGHSIYLEKAVKARWRIAKGYRCVKVKRLEW